MLSAAYAALQERDRLLDVAGATVQVSDPIIGKGNNLAAGFTEYTEPSRLQWTFTYDEVFFIVEGALEVHAAQRDGAVKLLKKSGAIA